MNRDLHTLKCVLSLAAVMALLFCLTSCEHDDAPFPGTQGSGRLITFSAEDQSEWPDMTKSAIGSVGELLGDGFIVWGSWTKCPDDDSYWVGDYASGKNNAVFSALGTTVTATDKNKDGKFNQSQDAWEYAPEREWYKGYYTFAAAIPASDLSENGITGTHTSSVSFEDDEPVYTNILTLNFPDNIFDLSSTQIDLMTAFATQDNSAETADQIRFQFDHVCSKLNINLAAYDPNGTNRTLEVQSIVVYGLLNSIASPLEFTQTVTQNTSNVTAQIAASTDRSTQEDPFHLANKGWEIPSSTLEDPEGEELIKDLLVFPGTLSVDNPLKLRIDYKNVNNVTKSIFVKVTQGTWEAGHTYSYTFQADLGALE